MQLYLALGRRNLKPHLRGAVGKQWPSYMGTYMLHLSNQCWFTWPVPRASHYNAFFFLLRGKTEKAPIKTLGGVNQSDWSFYSVRKSKRWYNWLQWTMVVIRETQYYMIWLVCNSLIIHARFPFYNLRSFPACKQDVRSRWRQPFCGSH